MSLPKDLSKFYVSYTVTGHPNGLTPEELQQLGGEVGAAHDLLIFSVMHQENGRVSVAILSETHDQKDMPADKFFEILLSAMSWLIHQLPSGANKDLATTIVQSFLNTNRKKEN